MYGRNQRGNDRVVRISFAAAALLSVGTGCEFDSSGLPKPRPASSCTLDFRVSQINLDLEPDSGGLQTEGTLAADQAFSISWSWGYTGEHDFEGIYVGPYEYMTRVKITKGEEVVFESEFLSEPVDVGDNDGDKILFDDGLPIGNYEFEVFIDTQGDVPECLELAYAVNNWKVMEFTVEAQPVGGLSRTPGG